MRFSLIFILLIAVSYSSLSQSGVTSGTGSSDDDTPKYSNEFLNIGVGARALGMSNSFIASADDVYAGYWNPAGLVDIEDEFQGAVMHSEYFAGIAKYDYIGLAKSIDNKSSVGFSIIRFGVDDIPNTTQLIDAQGNLDYDRVTTFSAADYGFIFSYARRLKKTGVSFGSNAKIIYRRIGDFSNAFGFGIDASINYDYKKYRFSAVGRDITTTVNSWNTDLGEEVEEIFTLTGNEIPGKSLEVTLPRIILAAKRLTSISEKLNLITEIDLNFTTDGRRNTVIQSDNFSADPTFGLELSYKDKLFIRGGIGNIQEASSLVPIDLGAEEPSNEETITSEWTFQPNFGLGLKLKNITLDYALTDIGNASDALYSNVFSIRLSL
ncbi:MAG: PorV/PorQ family protein [Flavobacteriales bacterium]